jgi:hypothetical protein
MKNILPIVFNPSNRCGVVASMRAIPAVDSGSVNHAQVKLYSRLQHLLALGEENTYCSSRLLKDIESSDRCPDASLRFAIVQCSGLVFTPALHPSSSDFREMAKKEAYILASW